MDDAVQCLCCKRSLTVGSRVRLTEYARSVRVSLAHPRGVLVRAARDGMVWVLRDGCKGRARFSEKFWEPEAPGDRPTCETSANPVTTQTLPDLAPRTAGPVSMNAVDVAASILATFRQCFPGAELDAAARRAGHGIVALPQADLSREVVQTLIAVTMSDSVPFGPADLTRASRIAANNVMQSLMSEDE